MASARSAGARLRLCADVSPPQESSVKVKNCCEGVRQIATERRANIAENYEIFAYSGPEVLELSGHSLLRHVEQGPKSPERDESAAIIVFADGEQNMGMSVALAAKEAADRGVRVFTVGVGTPEGGTAMVRGWVGRAGFDAARLKEAAEITGGHYFHLNDRKGVARVARGLSARLIPQTTEIEVGALFTAFAFLLALAAAVCSLTWASQFD